MAAGGRYRELPTQDQRRGVRDRRQPEDGDAMRLRGRRIRITVAVQDGERPIILCAGPGCTVEADLDETRQLILQLHDAYERARQRGG